MNHAPCGVYALIDSSTQEIFYVGCSEVLNHRIRTYDIRLGRRKSLISNQKLTRKLMLSRLDGNAPYVAILEFCPKRKLLERESVWIHFCLAVGYNLLNVSINNFWGEERLSRQIKELLNGKAEALFIGTIKEARNYVRLMSSHKQHRGSGNS